MLSVEEARARILQNLAPLGQEIVALAAAHGRVLAAPIAARRTQPPADISAMDGYALRAADQLAPRRIIGSAPAGHPFAGQVGPGEAVAVFTGSVIPAGADSVLLQEDADCAGAMLNLREAIRPGQHIRPRGQDFADGDMLLAAGRPLNARDIGLAASANHPWLAVHRRPRVAILSTGDEIALPGEPVPAGGIVSANGSMLAALCVAAGAEPILLPNADDSEAAIAASVAGAGAIDMLITTGGASVGAHDKVQRGLGDAGFALDFWKIAMRPGKPMIAGAIGKTPVLGLPGNPVSAFACAVLFVLPALWRLAGRAEISLPLETAALGRDLPANDHRADHLRASLSVAAGGGLIATPHARQDSGMMRILASADALLLRPAGAPPAQAGDTVTILRLAAIGL